MKTEFRCPRCGQAFGPTGILPPVGRRVALRARPENSRAGRSANCGAELLSTRPAGRCPRGFAIRRAERPQAQPLGIPSSKLRRMQYLRPWVFETSQVQGIGTWLVILSAADLLMTFALLRRSDGFFRVEPDRTVVLSRMGHDRHGFLQVFDDRRRDPL